ncbi:flagellar protein FlaG [Bacillus sp. HMF5848]|uniref:flagellar protein FlaG n=1 Tax=Bacillus sp. HMF5848 TaxID=2495421 RepID=UPI000F77AF79|nr:flagellar protein FlaG [Bacillus sp. HMF5848]RSK28609.1 flagellar protein FlaG [Bacillus sp. HMF5848]
MSIDRISSNISRIVSYQTNDSKVQKQADEIEVAKLEQANNIVKEEKFDKEQLKEVVDGMNKFIKPTNTALKFELHEKLQEYYVTIVDERTNEVVREIPPKKLLDMYAAMTEFLGLVVDKKI